jgi:hypothetical protein
MVAEIPLTLELYDGMVGSPSYYWIENHSLIGKRSIRIVTNGIAQQVAVSRRVREIVFAIILVHPGCLEEAMRIASLHGFAILVEHYHTTRSLCKLLYIVAHANHAAVNGRRISGCKEFALMVRSSTQVNESVLIAILSIDRTLSVG